jgi:hypothetical protein
MATASDAKGVLPQWMQNLAVPGAVAKDVEMFLSWIPSQRNDSNGKPAPITKSASPEKTLPAAPASNENVPFENIPPPISKVNDKPVFQRAESANKVLPAAPVQ